MGATRKRSSPRRMRSNLRRNRSSPKRDPPSKAPQTPAPAGLQLPPGRDTQRRKKDAEAEDPLGCQEALQGHRKRQDQEAAGEPPPQLRGQADQAHAPSVGRQDPRSG